MLASIRSLFTRSAPLTEAMTADAMTWEELAAHGSQKGEDLSRGATNMRASVRLFGKATEKDVKVTLYRDNHGWCPYCQKVLLWLEEREVPYYVEKVTMFCYGDKEPWYKRIVPSGMLPAARIDGQLYTESDVILGALEARFGAVGRGMSDPAVVPLRKLERTLFRAWCQWLCYPARSAGEERAAEGQFVEVLTAVDRALGSTSGPYFLAEFSTADVVFTPYIERMAASLFYYKGFNVKDEDRFPRVAGWFRAMEGRSTYRGTQSDYHTHAHDLPPQMGGCYSSGTAGARKCSALVDHGPYEQVPDASYGQSREEAVAEAVHRVVKHHHVLAKINPGPHADAALRCALTGLVRGRVVTPPPGTDVTLRYLQQRINVPRDMGLHAARVLRAALGEHAAAVGEGEGPVIPLQHRLDQDPSPFRTKA